MTGKWGRFFVLVLLVAAAGLTLTPFSDAAKPNKYYLKDVTSRDGKVWALDFTFTEPQPRLIKVNIPGRGERICWYLLYSVINKSGEPRTFVPDFELVTHDTGMSYKDQILPAVQDKIIALEDKFGLLKLKNSVTISAEPIPVTLPKAVDRPVHGVAIWTDPNEPLPDDSAEVKKQKAGLPKLIDSSRYSIFVGGLSNGYSLSDPVGKDTRHVVRRKTLQLTFRRYGDKFLMRSDAIKFQPPAQWVYRAAAKIKLPERPKDADSK
jgi:hypothetical protein